MTARLSLCLLLVLGGCKSKPLDRATVVADSDASAVVSASPRTRPYKTGDIVDIKTGNVVSHAKEADPCAHLTRITVVGRVVTLHYPEGNYPCYWGLEAKP